MHYRWHLAAIALAIVLAPALAAAAPRTKTPPEKTTEVRGWNNPRALQLAREGIEAKKSGNAELCIQKDQASLALEDHPYVKLHLASCLQAVGKLIEALGKAKDSLAEGLRSNDDDLSKAAQARVAELLPRISHVKLLLPVDATGTKVTFDNIPVRATLFRQRIAVDPGDHVVEAERVVKGERQEFKERITLAEGEDRSIEIVLKSRNIDQATLDCLERAQNYDEKLACVERKASRPTVHIGTEFSGYSDSTHVQVLSPAINAAVASPTEGWNIGASYLIDIVSAASPDIVSMASPAYKEQRHAVAAGGGYKFGDVGVSVNGNLSDEPDYVSTTGGAAVDTELAEKTITPRLGYNFTYDRIGIRNTPFSQFEQNLATHEIEAGATFVMSTTTLLVTGLTAQIERGEESKLYRYVPLFAPAIASLVSPGESVASVNDNRLPLRARENLPRERNRLSLGARINHRLPTGTVRAEERLYYDTWGVKATTTDIKYYHDLGEHLRVWPHLRFHGQSGASFYRLAYPALLDDAGTPLTLYTYRTGDRELSPMIGVTLGAGARISLSGENAKVEYAITVAGELMLNHYFQSLYIQNRSAVYGTLGFEANF